MLIWLVLLKLVAAVTALDNGVGLTPPMGWLSWLYSGCSTDCVKEPKKCLSEQLVKRTADRLVADGYRDAGYKYVIIDDCWPERERGPDGKMIPDKTRFKSGMKALGDYIHSKGLKFGIYGDIGSKTCQGYPGSAGYELLDAQTFAEWGVDYVKVDGCYENIKYFNLTYPMFGKALNQTSRPIHYSCSWPAYQENYMEVDYKAISETCNTWRNYEDIYPNVESILRTLDWYGDNRDRLAPYSGPGHFHDPDMLVAGHPGISTRQALIQLCLWATLAAPLMISADLDTFSIKLRKRLQNEICIRFQQDPAGLMGFRTIYNDDIDVWARASTVQDELLIVSVNKNFTLHDTVTINLPLKKLGLQSGTYQIQYASAETKEIVHLKDELVYEFSPQDANIFKLTLLNSGTVVEDNDVV